MFFGPPTPLCSPHRTASRLACRPAGSDVGSAHCDRAGFCYGTNIRFGPDGCAYVVDYGAVRDLGSDSHFVGPPANGPLVQIPGTGV
jgi:hypothetical protein